MAHHGNRESRVHASAKRYDLAEAGMMQAFLKRLFRFQEMILLLSLMLLACLPIALGSLVRGASMSLFLPVTLLGMLIAWALAQWNIHKLSAGIILLVMGPLVLFFRVGQMDASLFEAIKQTFNLIPALIAWLRFKITFDVSSMLLARDDLVERFFVIGGRLNLWLTGLIHDVQVEDPVVRTLVWSMALWLVAVWAGWQIYRNKQLLSAVLPSTLLLALVLDYTGKQLEILWLHLTLLLFLYGLTSYANTQNRWRNSKIDYSDSTSIDTLMLVGALTMGLVAVSYLVSTISVKDILEDLREKRTASNETPAQALGLEPPKNTLRVSGTSGGLPRSYLIGSGPELSDQLAMTISTADLSPMPLYAHPIVPRYYWRTFTYQIYTGAGWANPYGPVEDVSSDQMLFEPLSQSHKIVNQQVTFPDETKEFLYWTGTLVRADVPFQAVWNRKADSTPQTNPLLDSDLRAAAASVRSYQAVSILLNISAAELRESPGLYPDWVRKQFLALPESVPERVMALARDLTASEPTPYDRALAIQNHLREFPYTLDVPAPPRGRDVADYFLFDLQKGYCDYYATAMVILARAAGLPARLVVGYANGSYDVESAQYIITEEYAHSWVEIYFANIGWVEFEPTASQPVILHKEIDVASTPEQVLQQSRSLSEQVATLFQRAAARIWLPAVFLTAIILAWIGWDSLRMIRLEPSQVIQLLYKRLRRLARPVSGIVPVSQTAQEYAYVLTALLSALKARPRMQNLLSPSYAEIHQLTELYSRSLFASAILTHAEVRNAVKTWSRLRWRLMLANILRIKKTSNDIK
jgi:transglutaminase-like putative cysteine protease